MDKSQLSMTEETRMEDDPITSVEEQGGVDKEKALLSSGSATVDREKSQMRKIVDSKGNTIYIPMMKKLAGRRPARGREACKSWMVALNGIMEALTCGHNTTIGVVLGPESTESADLLEKVSRRVNSDELFDVVVMASVTHKPNYGRIQDEIGEALGLKFDHVKDLAKKARRLRERILMEHKILVILRDLCMDLDLGKVGIPYGADHTGCKLLLTSASDEVLSNQMHAQKIFKV